MSTVLMPEMNHLPPALTQRSDSRVSREAAGADSSAAEPLCPHTDETTLNPSEGRGEGHRDDGGCDPLHLCVTEPDPVHRCMCYVYTCVCVYMYIYMNV